MYKQKGGHWADSQMAVMCAGRGTLASSTQLSLEFAGTSTQQVQLELFPEYRQILRLNFDSGVYEVSQLLKSQLSLDLVTGRRYLRERRHGAIDALLALLTRYLRRSFCFLVFAGGPRCKRRRFRLEKKVE